MSDNNSGTTDYHDPTTGIDSVPLDPPPAYEPKPEDVNDSNVSDQLLVGQPTSTNDNEERTDQPNDRVAPWKSLLVYGLIAILSYWLTLFLLHTIATGNYRVIYSSSYSNEYRFRPAASPILTETLADGRTRIHGAQPTAH